MNLLLETERLCLKTLDKEAAHVVPEYYERNREFLKEWEPYRGDDFYTVEYQEKLLSKDAEEMEKGNALKLWLFKKGGAGKEKAIGMIAFNNIIRGVFLSCHLGYKLDKDEIGKGYMTEALKAGIDYVFSEYKLQRRTVLHS